MLRLRVRQLRRRRAGLPRAPGRAGRTGEGHRRSPSSKSQGRYIEAEHDLFFEAFDENALTADDLARFPDYLVCIPPDRNDAPENANLMEMLSSGLPVKVLVQTSDLLEEASIGTGRFAFGVRSARLATAAMGLGGMFVLQSPSANLYALRAQIGRGLACRGPALFSVFAGSPRSASHLPPYLSAAAAMQSRAFPAFSYDAAAGGNWAARFSLENNPQPDDDWSVETPGRTSTPRCSAPSERCAFTFADFVLCDARYAAHFALVPRERWSAAMLPVADWLALDEPDAAKRVPYLLAVDGQDALQRVIVDAQLMQATRRCQLLWRRLQEHGGVHDSHAERLLAREKAAWAAEQQAGSRRGRQPPWQAAAARRAAAPPRPPRPNPRRRRIRATKPGSTPRAARAATNASSSTTACSPTTNASRPTSRTSTPAPTASWSRRPKAARWRSSTPASRAIRTSPGSRSCWCGPSRSADLQLPTVATGRAAPTPRHRAASPPLPARRGRRAAPTLRWNTSS